MLSRRNVRIKIMQLLFSQNRDNSLTDEKVVTLYHQSLDKSFELYLLNLFLLIKVAEYSVVDKKKRHGKYLPKPEDLLFSAKLFENDCLQSLLKNEALEKKFDDAGFEDIYDNDITAKVYREFSKDEQYEDYVYNEASTHEDDIKILLSLFKTIIKSDLILEIFDSYYPNWEDDKSLIVGVMKKSIKSLPVEGEFYEEHRPNDDTVKDFGLRLLNSVIAKEDDYKGKIESILENWDVDRVAVIDIILLKMASAEFLLFPSIPTKVTINEYLEISKLYSTDKSKDFINGVLDKLLQVLDEEGEVDKKGRGLE